MARTLAALLTVALAGIAAVPAGAAPKNGKSPGDIAAYWSAERMHNAKPREAAKPGGGGGGKPTTSDWSRYEVALSGGRYTGENAKNGKVFVTIGGSDYVCSGTAVAANSGVNLVWTAGHCVTDGPGQDATNFMFVPGYYRGAAPYGRWAATNPATNVASTPTWRGGGADRFRQDVGAARVTNTTNASSTFDGTVGTRPVDFGHDPTGTRIVAHGYPAAGKFHGDRQFACASPFRRWDGTALLDPMQISCDMTGGSSGGGWFHDLDGNRIADAGEPLVSVNSYGYPGEKNTMYGPYMPNGSEAEQLYESLKTAP